MEESLERIRKWMSESKFSEAQKASEVLLLQSSDHRHQILSLYVDSLLEQKKNPDSSILLELIELEANANLERALSLLSHLGPVDQKIHHRQIQFLKIKMAEKRGHLSELHDLISGFQIYLYENNIPAFPGLLSEMIEKYFRDDFGLRLQQLSLTLLLHDFAAAEKTLEGLFLSTVEKASPKGIREKMQAIASILDASDYKAYLEVYRGLCLILNEGVSDKARLKKLVEAVIFFDSFKLQSLVLNIIFKAGLNDLCSDYAQALRSHPEYDFVYFEKYYPHLKALFVQAREKVANKALEDFSSDLRLVDDSFSSAALLEPLIDDHLEDELRIINLFKYRDYSNSELLEIATSFLQAELPGIALKAVEKVLAQKVDDTTYLKANYLRLTCHLLVGDSRAALDCALSALDRAQSRDDILSFLYGEAEAYIRLGQVKDARRVLTEILSIDAEYRMTRERLEKLNEI
jgi:hypothetical protein